MTNSESECNPSHVIDDQGLPHLFREADSASVEAQHRYLRLIRAELTLMVIAAALAGVWHASSDIQNFLAVATAVAFVLGLLLTNFMRTTHYERTWFSARALAESIKTLSWKYITAAEPFVQDLEAPVVDEMFSTEVGILLSAQRNVASELKFEPAGELITEVMRETRGADLESRKSVYCSERISSQRKWYSGKATYNSNAARRWLVAVGMVQLLGAVAAIVVLRWEMLPIDLTGIFAALAAAIFAWLPVKQHRQLATSYAMAAVELALIEAKVMHMDTETRFAEFVSDAESAISREHTMWHARRDSV